MTARWTLNGWLLAGLVLAGVGTALCVASSGPIEPFPITKPYSGPDAIGQTCSAGKCEPISSGEWQLDLQEMEAREAELGRIVSGLVLVLGLLLIAVGLARAYWVRLRQEPQT